jgi:hypothetical protein
MNIRRFAPILIAAAFAPAAWADSVLDFTLENRTGYTLKEVYVSPSKKDNWGKQILKAPLKDGANLKLNAPGTAKTQSYDLKAVYMDGAGSPVWYDLEPSKFSRLTLKWDKAKNKTVAVKHR